MRSTVQNSTVTSYCHITPSQTQQTNYYIFYEFILHLYVIGTKELLFCMLRWSFGNTSFKIENKNSGKIMKDMWICVIIYTNSLYIRCKAEYDASKKLQACQNKNVLEFFWYSYPDLNWI